MVADNTKPFLLIASFPESVLNFRGPLIMSVLATGLPVHVAAPGLPRGAPVRLSLEALGIKVHNIPLSRTGTDPAADFKLLFHLYCLLRKIQPAAMLSYTVKPVIYGTLAGWLARVPHRYALVTGLGYAFTGEAKGKRALLQRLVRSLYRQALKRADLTFFQNPDDQMLFRQLGLLGSVAHTQVVNGSGIDIARFEQAPLPKERVRFLLIARLLGDKGVREYVQAAKRVRALHPHVRFGLVGWIDENPDAIGRDELHEWVGAGHIDYLGRLVDVRPVIAEASVYVLPSYREGTPRTVLEAMAMGRAIITTDAPGCRETVVEGENGFFVPVKSVDALVSAMEKFISEPKLVASMGQRSRDIAEEKYDVHKVNAVMLEAMGITTSP